MLPKQLKYQTRVNGTSARAYRSNIRPTSGGSFALGDTIEFQIPTRANLVLVPSESYLRFDLTVTNSSGSASTYRFDKCGAHGLFQRVRGWNGSNPLEDINNYGMLSAMLYNLQMTDDNVKFKQSVLAGTRTDVTTTYTTGATFQATQANILLSRSVNSGRLISQSLATGSTSAVQTYCLNLISMFGSLTNQQYFPLFACTSDSLRLELQVVDSIAKFCNCTSAVGSISISNIEYCAQMIELSDDAMGIILASLQGQPLQFVANTIRNFPGQASLPASSAYNTNIQINARFSSVKSILVSRRDQGLGTATYFPFSSVKAGISQYQFTIGSVILPPKPPTKIAEMYAELIKTGGGLSDTMYTPSIGLEDYDTNSNSSTASAIATDPGYSTVSSSNFYIGLDLEQYVNSSKDTVFAGYNTNTDQISLIEQGTNSVASVVNLRYDAYVIIDQVFVFENDTVSVKF